jgi:drug/metabolite transporter (DMT)-like permease
MSLGSVQLIWWRMALAGAGFAAAGVGQADMGWRAAGALGGIGCVLTLRWILFFEAIARSNVALALTCMATAPLVTALLEPLLTRRKPAPYEYALGALAVVGIYLLFQVDWQYSAGLLWGLASAALNALYGLLNKRLVHRFRALKVNLYEIGGGWLALSVVLLGYGSIIGAPVLHLPAGWDLLWLGLLAFVCTNVAFYLGIRALQRVTAFAYMLAINLQPIYAILLAFLVFQEYRVLDGHFYAGALIVLASVLSYPLIRLRRSRRSV